MKPSHTIDKRKWPKGPWQDEPDFVEWIDDATGLGCKIVRHKSLGHLNGYVRVSRKHPIFSIKDGLSALVVHGGVTYSQPDEIAEALFWIGFDCSHHTDLSPALTWWPTECYRNIDYVNAQCASLARQLAAIEGEHEASKP